jgi:hypothetical protein
MGIDEANWIRLTQRPVAGFCEHGNEPSGSIKKAGLLFDKLRDCQLLKNILHRGVIK